VKHVAAEATLRALHQVREQRRIEAAEVLRAAQAKLERAERELEVQRDRLAKLLSAEVRGEPTVTAAVLQRKQACQVGLSTARTDAATEVRRAIVRVSEAQRTAATADQAWREACGEERVVERLRARRDLETKRGELRTEAEDNDDLAQRR